MNIETAEQITIQDNLQEFLNANPHISNVTFVFAHPDDIEGYSGGLVSRLAAMNATKVPAERYNLNFVVVTDGANGTKELVNREQLKAQRRAEQLKGLQVLLDNEEELNELSEGEANKVMLAGSNATVTFLNHPDSNLYEERLVEEIGEMIVEYGSDLIITHDDRPWGTPLTGNNPLLAVQNHTDHRMTANAVSKSVAKIEDTGADNVPLVLRATWEYGDVNVEFEGERKKRALAQHHSQYDQNEKAMDGIVDKLNDYEGRKFESFRLANEKIAREKALQVAMLSLTGTEIRNFPPLNELVAEQFQRQAIRRVLLLNGMPADPWQIEGVEVLRLDITSGMNADQVEEYIREYGIDFLVIPPDLPAEDLDTLHSIMMFSSSVSRPGFENLPVQKVKGAAYLYKNADGSSLDGFEIKIGLW